jgi:hypothetical protein
MLCKELNDQETRTSSFSQREVYCAHLLPLQSPVKKGPKSANSLQYKELDDYQNDGLCPLWPPCTSPNSLQYKDLPQ